jgi:hypothetical protein
VLADQIPDAAIFKAGLFKGLPRLRDCPICWPLGSSETLKSFNTFKESSGKHACCLISADKLDILLALGVTQAQIGLLNKTSEPVTLLVDKKQILFCIADTPAAQQKIFFDCLEQKKWPLPLK